MGAWNAWQSLDLECVARDEGGIFGVEDNVVAMNSVIGKLGIEEIGVAEGAGRVEIVDSDGACMTRNLNIWSANAQDEILEGVEPTVHPLIDWVGIVCRQA